MEARVARLGEDVRELKGDMKMVRADTAWLRGRVEQLPTTWVLVTTITGSMVALLGLTFTVLRFGITPH